MITIFILLGLGFLCGGIAAIVDGLPYMVLERGFTQVIIGTVVAVAGVLMLALSWVLVELRRLKKTLSNAAMAMSVASMAGGPVPESIVAAPSLRSEPEPEGQPAASRPGLAAAGVGAFAGAGAVLAATHLPAATAAEKSGDGAAEPDPFGARLAEVIRSEPGLDRDTLDEPSLADVDALPTFDPLRRPVDPQGELVPEAAAAADHAPEPEPEPENEPENEHEPAPEAARLSDVVAPVIELEARPMIDDADAQEAEPAVALPDEPPEVPVAQHAPSDIENPLMPEAAPAAARERDEFGMLRDSLAGLGLGLAPEPADGRIEPSFKDVYRPVEHADAREGSRADDLAAAASWMEPALQRRAPWFETAAPAAEEPAAPPKPAEPAMMSETSWPKLDVANPTAPEYATADHQGPAFEAPAVDLPPWPPHARDADPFEPESTASPGQAWDDTVGAQAAAHASSLESRDEATTGSEAEPVAPVDVAPEGDAGPAASDEGIVGAYQVGEAHFTIYADGSIQARTPDGDYSFASMDELKVYLASEKSRLGV